MRATLLAAFFLSGFAALTWEMSWVRQLVSLFGVTWFAITTILTVFMAGLALGSVLAGRLVDRRRWPPLLLFAVLELFLAAYGLAFGSLLDAVEGLYLSLSLDQGFQVHALLRFVFGALLLLPPTLASGATLPAAAKAFVGPDIGGGVARLYGANVAGAAAGCFATSFLLIGLLGYPGTAVVGASANGLAAVLALGVWRARPSTSEGPSSVVWTPQRSAVAAVYLVVGFCALSAEVLWSRAFSQFGVNSATSVFGLVLVSFLVGHGLGSSAIGSSSLRRGRGLFVGLQVGFAALTALSVLALLHRPTTLVPVGWLRDLGLLLPGERAWLLIPAVMLPAACSGALFPLASGLSIGGPSAVGRGVGSLAALSTVGGIAGSALTGFLLMPALGTVHCLVLVAMLSGVGALGSAWALDLWAPRRVLLAGLGVLVLGGGLAAAVPTSAHLLLFPGEEVLLFVEGRNSSTAVTRSPLHGTTLLVHGERIKSGGSSPRVAFAFHPSATQLAIIGLGSGSMAQEALEIEELERVTAIDIDGDLPTALPWMRDMERFVGPRWEFVEDDGRHFLLTSDRRFDILLNDAAIYAWYLELSTLEFNQLARSRLNEEGLYLGRLHLDRITEEAFRREVATFIAVFPNAAMWGLSDHLGLLVGRNGEQPVDRADVAARLWYDADGLALLAEGQEPITDDHPLHAPHTFKPLEHAVLEFAVDGELPGARPSKPGQRQAIPGRPY